MGIFGKKWGKKETAIEWSNLMTSNERLLDGMLTDLETFCNSISKELA